MARKTIERNIAFDEVRQKYYVTLDYGKDDLGKRQKVVKTFGTLKDARVALVEFQYNKTRGNIAAPKKETVGEYITYWLNDVKALECRNTTLYGYKNIVEKHIIPYLGNVEVQNLSAQHINRYSSYLSTKKGLSNNTIKKHQDLLKSMLYTAKAEKLIINNFMEDMKLIVSEQKVVEVYRLNQVEKLFVELKGYPIELGVKLELYLGLRRGEINGLKWENVDIENHVIYIRETRTAAGAGVCIGKPKTKKSVRNLCYEGELIGMLEYAKQKYDECKKKYGNTYNPDGNVICKGNGELYHVNYFSNEFKRFLEGHGLQHIKFHGLRHTCATIANSAGMTIFDIAHMLGHSSPNTTAKIYVHHLDDENSKVVNAVANAIQNKIEC